jgi:ubiquinone/menaquinone biosynthesis C-methylase UbiE
MQISKTVALSTELPKNLSGVDKRTISFYSRATELYMTAWRGRISGGYWEGGIETIEEAGQNMTRHLLKLCKIEDGHSVCDVAFGEGNLMKGMAQNYNLDLLAGIDIYKPRVDRVFRRLTNSSNVNVDLVHGTVMKMPERWREEFDRISCTEAVYHFPDRVGALKEMLKCLKPGGRLIITDVGVKNKPTRMEELTLRKMGSINEYALDREGYLNILSPLDAELKHYKDISEKVAPTMSATKKELIENKQEMLAIIEKQVKLGILADPLYELLIRAWDVVAGMYDDHMTYVEIVIEKSEK